MKSEGYGRNHQTRKKVSLQSCHSNYFMQCLAVTVTQSQPNCHIYDKPFLSKASTRDPTHTVHKHIIYFVRRCRSERARDYYVTPLYQAATRQSQAVQLHPLQVIASFLVQINSCCHPECCFLLPPCFSCSIYLMLIFSSASAVIAHKKKLSQL